jgi:hypothetical protein
MLGVGAVYELPKNVHRVGDVDCVHRMSADVRIPSGHGGWEARSYMRLALGLWYLLLVCDVRQGFWRGWWVVVRNDCNIGGGGCLCNGSAELVGVSSALCSLVVASCCLGCVL